MVVLLHDCFCINFTSSKNRLKYSKTSSKVNCPFDIRFLIRFSFPFFVNLPFYSYYSMTFCKQKIQRVKHTAVLQLLSLKKLVAPGCRFAKLDLLHACKNRCYVGEAFHLKEICPPQKNQTT